MQILHTSHNEIKEITNDGLFNDCLFFSDSEYSMGTVTHVYALEIEESEIIDACDLEDEDTIEDIKNYFECDEDTAIELLNADADVYSLGFDYEADYYLQAARGQAAKNEGYKACRDEDEQGNVYIVPMMGRESELKLIKTI